MASPGQLLLDLKVHGSVNNEHTLQHNLKHALLSWIFGQWQIHENAKL